MNTKKIQLKDLKVGMKIKTMQDGQIVFKEVTDVWATQVLASDQRIVHFDNISLHCSKNHPLMLDEEQQVLPDQAVGLEIITDHGAVKVQQVTSDRRDTGYIDISVADTHTFFASAAANGDMVLTHNSQGGIRNASATVNLPIWHYQFDDFIVLKNNKGTEESRVRQMDYCVVMNAFFWRRFKNKGYITFFDPNQVPELYEAFYADSAKFEELYVKYEKRKDLRTKIQPAEVVIRDWLLTERVETGRIYLLNIDNVANQGPFDATVHPIYQTNLCTEIMLPTESFQTIDDAGSLVFEYCGEEVSIPNTASARLVNGEIKLVRFISAEDDVVAFLYEDGRELLLQDE